MGHSAVIDSLIKPFVPDFYLSTVYFSFLKIITAYIYILAIKWLMVVFDIIL